MAWLQLPVGSWVCPFSPSEFLSLHLETEVLDYFSSEIPQDLNSYESSMNQKNDSRRPGNPRSKSWSEPAAIETSHQLLGKDTDKRLWASCLQRQSVLQDASLPLGSCELISLSMWTNFHPEISKMSILLGERFISLTSTHANM